MSFVSKILMFTGLLLVVSVICIWIAGGETTKHSTSITIDAAKEQIFPYLTESDRIKRWARDVVDVGSFTADGPSMQERQIRDESGKVVIVSDEVMRFKAPESFSFKSTSNGMTQTYVFQLDDNEVDGTNLEYRSTRSASGMGRMFFPFSNDDTDARMVSEMRKLKEVIESDVEQGLAPEIVPIPSTPEPEVSSDDNEPVAKPVATAEPTSEQSTPRLSVKDMKIQPSSSAEEASTAVELSGPPSVDAPKAAPEKMAPTDEPQKVAASKQVQSPRTNPAKQDVSKQDLSKRKFESLFGTGR